jgi:DNA-binding transcriptional ArsR family regulator
MFMAIRSLQVFYLDFSLFKTLDKRADLLYITNRLINYMVKHRASADSLSIIFAALADPTRRAILARLTDGPATVNDLAEPFQMSLPAISKHLKVLERAGLITRGRNAQWRPCTLEAAPLKEVADWTERYRRFYEESFERLDEVLDKLKKTDHQQENQKENHDA